MKTLALVLLLVSICYSAPVPYRDFQIKTPVLTPIPPSLPNSCVVTFFTQHAFRDSTPAVVDYVPPKGCGGSTSFSSIILNITVTSNGTQFDRLALLFLNKTEIWRTSSAEPTRDGIIWTTVKDVTLYRSLFAQNNQLIVHMGNIIEGPYDGVFLMTLTATFLPNRVDQEPTPDLFYPISRFVTNATDAIYIGSNGVPASTMISIPKNCKSAWLEIYASGNAQEEFWYTNPTDNIAQVYSAIGKGPFREVQAWVDGLLAGAVFPFPTIYTGGINPLLWRPSSSYASFDQVTYYVDITPFLGTLSDGAPHNFTIDVRGQGQGGSINDNWIVSGNLQVYLSGCAGATTGMMSIHDVGPDILDTETTTSIAPDNSTASCHVTATRGIRIESQITTCETHIAVKHTFTQALSFENSMQFFNHSNIQFVQQISKGSSLSVHGDRNVYQSVVSVPISINSSYVPMPGGAVISASVALSKVQINMVLPNEGLFSRTDVTQISNATMMIKNNVGYGGSGNQQLNFHYVDKSGNEYKRMLNVEKNRIKADQEGGSLKDNMSGFQTSLVDGPDAPIANAPTGIPRFYKRFQL